MSGGGRCNFTNYFIGSDNFLSDNPHFCKAALTRYTQWDFINLVEEYKINYEERKHSQLFCLDSAKDIQRMLIKECEISGVTIHTHCEIDSVNDIAVDDQHQYRITARIHGDLARLSCHSLVVATGALSIPSLGGSSMGYDIAQQFGLMITEKRAGLVPVMFSDATKQLCERLSGLSLEVEVTCHQQTFKEDLLFTHRGMSGPCILQISNYWHPGDEIQVNLLPEINVANWLIETKQASGKSLLKSILRKKLPKALVTELQALWWGALADQPLAEFTHQQLETIGHNINGWIVKPAATEGYRTAEVTLGGVNTDELSSKTMASKKQPNLYFIGEVVDVTGHLGGFNFQWAWSSGYSAGLFV